MVDYAFIDWVVVNSFAPWFSALGTTLSAVVALYLGLRRVKPALNLSCRDMLIISPNVAAETQNVIALSVVNHGEQVVLINGLGWVVGNKLFGEKIHMVQLLEFPLQPSIPYELRPQMSVSWNIPKDNWMDHADKFFPNRFSRWFPRLWLKTMKCQVFTATRYKAYCKVDRSIKKNMIARIQ